MNAVERLVLDVLKPHNPNAPEFRRMPAEPGDFRIRLTVPNMSARAEALRVTIEGEAVSGPEPGS